MVRALAVLTCGAFLTLVIGVVGAGKPVLTVVLGGLYTVLATVGFAWVHRRDQRAWSVAYVAAVLALAGVVFALDPGAGSTLLLVVLVSQSVLLLPLPAAVVVVADRAVGARRHGVADGLREGLGHARRGRAFAAVLTKLLRPRAAGPPGWPRPTSSCASTPLQAERLAAAQERNRVARDIHDGLGHALTVVQMQIKAARAVLPPEPGPGRRGAGQGAGPGRGGAGARYAARWARCASRGRRSPLPEALRALAEETSAAGVPTELDVTGTARPLPRRGRGVAVPGRAGGADQRPQARRRQPGRAGRWTTRGRPRSASRCATTVPGGRAGRAARASGCWGCASGPRTWAGG